MPDRHGLGKNEIFFPGQSDHFIQLTAVKGDGFLHKMPLIDMLDIDAEINRLLAELKHKESFLQGIVKKLSNEKFVNNAPAAVIELERKKQAYAESIIKSLKESLTILLKR